MAYSAKRDTGIIFYQMLSNDPVIVTANSNAMTFNLFNREIILPPREISTQQTAQKYS